MRTIEYLGAEYAYDESVLSSWRWQRAASGALGPAESYGAVDALLADPEAAYDALGDDAGAVLGLVAAIGEAEGDPKGSAPSRQRFKMTSKP